MAKLQNVHLCLQGVKDIVIMIFIHCERECVRMCVRARV